MSSRNQLTDSAPEPAFFPKGALAFFGIMLAAFAVIWLGMYFLLVQRQL